MSYDSVWGVEEDFTKGPLMELVEPSTCLVVQDVLRENVTAGDDVLEVGSGNGMLSRLSPELTRGFVLSDISGPVLDLLREDFPENEVREADAYDLPFPDESLDVVVGMCSYSILTKPDEAVREVSRVLKSGGRFVHFLNRLPKFAPLLANVVGLEDTFFPYTTEHAAGYMTVGIRVVQEALVEEFLLRSGKTPSEAIAEEVMRIYFATDSREWLLAPLGSEFSKASHYLSSVVDELFGTRKFDRGRWFGENMVSQLTAHGLVASERNVTRSAYFPCPELNPHIRKPFNHYHDVPEMVRADIDLALPDDVVRVSSTIRVIEARKIT